MTENIPIITVTCLRDLPLLNLQAQSISQYLKPNCHLYIVVNEEDSSQWNRYFDQHLRQYYSKHKLTILYRQDFESAWSEWIPSQKNPWSVGWETQQVLKLAISKHLDSVRYLVLDSQNFLVRPWDPAQYGLINGKVPCRVGRSVMPKEIYDDYVSTLQIDNPLHTIGMMSICTPIFFHTKLVQNLIDSTGGVKKFTQWFKNASKIKSEFILYELWAEKNGGSYAYHYMIPDIEDWANPYLRDCRTEEEFELFYNILGSHVPNAWASANHRAWGNMTDNQYQKLLAKLKDYGLFPDFAEYRANYVDIKI
jgi:hypothetical protein